jgi:ketosteroid isomerase-like protein
VDAGDAERFGAFFPDHATYTFGNLDTVIRRDAIVAATAAAADALPLLRHVVHQVAEVGDRLFCRYTIHTQGTDGADLALPGVTVLELAGDQVIDYRVHLDILPVVAGPLGLPAADPEAVEVARQAFAGLQRGAATGDWSGFVDLLTDDVRIMIPVPAHEENPPEGLLIGKDVAELVFASHHEELVTDVLLEAKRVTANGGGEADFVATSLNDEASARDLARRAVELGGGHVLVNNAGIFPFGPTHETTR